jgi:hypothetical protein
MAMVVRMVLLKVMILSLVGVVVEALSGVIISLRRIVVTFRVVGLVLTLVVRRVWFVFLLRVVGYL